MGSDKDMLAAFAELHHHALGYVKSLALKCAVDLGIPDAVHRRGGAASLSDIASDAAVHPSKLGDLERMMSLLTMANIFTATTDDDGGAVVYYGLTTTGRILAGAPSLSPVVQFITSPFLVSAFLSLPDWLRGSSGSSPAAASLFEVAHGCSQWEMASKDAELNGVINACMVADSQFLVKAIVDKGRHVFSGLSSLVDVGGGHGAATQLIAKEFPDVKCSVLDLPHVVQRAPAGDGKVHFVAGDMFESVPPADAVVLKHILHDWSDDDCVKILKRCKEAIPARSAGGKVIIMEMVRGAGPRDSGISEMEAMRNLFMIVISGMERDEREWKNIFSAAGFSNDYKITSILGPFSVIEIYP